MAELPETNRRLKADILSTILELDKRSELEMNDPLALNLNNASAELHLRLAHIIQNQLSGTSAEFDAALQSLSRLAQRCNDKADSLDNTTEVLGSITDALDKVNKLAKKAAKLMS